MECDEPEQILRRNEIGEEKHISVYKTIVRDKELLFVCKAAAVFLFGMILLHNCLEQNRSVCTILDGRQVLIHTTAATDPEEILAEAGIKLTGGDTYMARTGIREQEIRIHRATQPEMLVKQGQQYTKVLPCRILRYTDPTLPWGTEKILRKGKDGEMLICAEVTYANGTERQRKILTQTVQRHPVDEIVAVGIGRKPVEEETGLPVIGNGRITLPTGEVLTYDRVITSLATAYCDKGLTATGTQARVGAIAVDPDVIPYGTRMFIVSKDGAYVYGLATAEDCGSPDHIYDTRIDLHFDTYRECRAFGARYCRVYFLS